MNRQIQTLIERYPRLAGLETELHGTVRILVDVFERGGTLFTCGNGGSAADADHIAGELLKSFCARRPVRDCDASEFRRNYGEDGAALAAKLENGLRCISLLSHPALSSAFGNDVDPSLTFAQQLWVLARPGDAILGISTGGNAANVLAAFRTARVRGVTRILLTGQSGGKCRAEADVSIRVPEQETYRIQEFHLPVYHALCLAVEEHFFPEKR